MPVAAPAGKWPYHFRLAWGGTFFSTEIWSMSLHMSDASTVTNAARIAFAADRADEVKTKVQTYWTTTAIGANRYALLDWVKFNAIGEDGKYLSAASNSVAVAPAGVPQLTPPLSESHPPQLAVVLSMGTGFRSGLAVRSRTYLPAARLSLVTTGSPYIADSQVSTVATAFKAFLVDLNDWTGLDLGSGPAVCAVSKGRAADSDGITRDITDIRVGNVFDTVRSRRNGLRETYTTLAL